MRFSLLDRSSANTFFHYKNRTSNDTLAGRMISRRPIQTRRMGGVRATEHDFQAEFASTSYQYHALLQ
ncbi:hypothetical protein KCU67_g47, partial [Aureobasidium melanogenum]